MLKPQTLRPDELVTETMVGSAELECLSSGLETPVRVAVEKLAGRGGT